MRDLDYKNFFFKEAESWICGGYSFDVRFLATNDGSDFVVENATIIFGPIAADSPEEFTVEAGNLVIGQKQGRATKKVNLEILHHATEGKIEIKSRAARLSSEKLSYYSEFPNSNTWFLELNLQIRGGRGPSLGPLESANVDSHLRKSLPPFDGLSDAMRVLGLQHTTGSESLITIRVLPPVDLKLDTCVLSNDVLDLTLLTHEHFDSSLISLGVVGIPGSGLTSRRQIAGAIEWSDPEKGLRVGKVTVKLQNIDSALVMLLIGQSTVRRHWFIDPDKARNLQMLAIQTFDRDLKMIRNAVFDSHDSARFEAGIAALLFVKGFSPSVQLETDAPDVIMSTPGGRLAIVECTTRIANFHAKLGKLVDRRGALQQALEACGHPAEVVSILICRLRRAQIAADERELSAKKVVLFADEDLREWFDQGRFRQDPDQMLIDAIGRLRGNDRFLQNDI